jgi:hypothetical protein
MPYVNKRQTWGPSCPSGGTWYACGTGSKFVGCCANDPCALGCLDGNLYPASFDPAFFGEFPDLVCNPGSAWYTCAGSKPPFMGCCSTNPCDAGCPPGDLTPGFLSGNYFIDCQFFSSGCSASPTTGVPATPTAPDTPSSSAPAPVSQHAPSRVIAAAAGGSVAGFIVVILLVIHWYRFSARRRKMRVEVAALREKESTSPPSLKGIQLVSARASESSKRSSTTKGATLPDQMQNSEGVTSMSSPTTSSNITSAQDGPDLTAI